MGTRYGEETNPFFIEWNQELVKDVLAILRSRQPHHYLTSFSGHTILTKKQTFKRWNATTLLKLPMIILSH